MRWTLSRCSFQPRHSCRRYVASHVYPQTRRRLTSSYCAYQNGYFSDFYHKKNLTGGGRCSS